jgi:hypothetical protein
MEGLTLIWQPPDWCQSSSRASRVDETPFPLIPVSCTIPIPFKENTRLHLQGKGDRVCYFNAKTIYGANFSVHAGFFNRLFFNKL